MCYSGNDSIKYNGVGIICHREIASAVMGYKPVNDRIITIKLQGMLVNMTIIQIYAPTTTNEDTVAEFDGLRQQTVDDTPNGDVLIICDMNAKVGENEKSMTTGRFGLGIRNEAGERLMEFCEAQNSLQIMNTIFKQSRCRLYTWTSPDGKYKNQIDYIMCRSRWISTIQSTHTFPGADCGTDHEFMVAEVKGKLKKLRKEMSHQRYYVSKISSSYNVELGN